MTKIGYKQSAEHKRKRLSQIEGDSNGRWAGGHHPDYYRKKAGAKTNDGTIVHHKNGDRENNKKSNLERLTDGDCVPGRRTTPKHEQITDRTSRKDGTKGKRCPGGYWIPQSKKCALKQSGLPPSAPQSEKKSGKKPGIENSIWPATALAIAGTGVVGLGTAGYLATTAIERARDGDAPSPKIRQRKDGTKGKRCPGGYWIPKSKKCASGQTGSTLKQVENFNHRTKEGGTKSAIENIVWPATALAIAGAGVAGLGIAGYAIASGSGKPSGNAEKKQLIKTIVSAEEKKNPEVTIAPPAEKQSAPTPPPVPKNDRPRKGLIRVPKSSGNAEKKKLIETIVKAEEKKRSSSVKQQTKLAEGDGWKLHLSTDDPALVSENLTKMGLKHKTGRNSGQVGKDVTVYVGNGAAAKKAAEAIEKKLGQHLKNPPEGSDTATDDVQVHGKVWGRFALHQDPRFHQYGSKGFPWLNDDMGQYHFIQDPQEKALFKEAANRRALAVLAKDYPEDFAGIDVSIAPPIEKKKKTKKGAIVHVPGAGRTHTFTPQPAIQAAVAKAKAIEKGSLINPPGRPPNDWADFKRKNPKGAYRKKKKTTDSTIAIRLAMKQAV